MTGKANPYANEIRFESGTLKSSQIDPFGATVERDEASGRYRFVSEPEVQARAERANALAEVENLIRLNQRLLEMNRQWKKSKPGDPVMLESTLVPQTTFNALETKINESVVNLAASGVSSSAELPPDAEAARLCPPGSQTRRGFQTMGPQGMKTFDQDERLIMAMTSEAKPLISTLTEVSSRILKSEEASLAESDLLLPLMREQLRVSNMRNLILRNPMSPDFNPGAFVGALTEQLDFEEE